jgi:hypothetical protein
MTLTSRFHFLISFVSLRSLSTTVQTYGNQFVYPAGAPTVIVAEAMIAAYKKQAEAQLRRVVEDTRADAELEIQRVRTQLESEHVAAKDEALAEQREYLGRTSEMRIQDAVADATETQRNKMAMAHRVQLDGSCKT